MPTKFLGVSLAASIAFAAWLILPALFAGVVTSGELDAFGVGVSTDPVKVFDTEEDAPTGAFQTVNTPTTIPADMGIECEVLTVRTSRGDVAAATNVSTPLAHFSDGYYGGLMPNPGCDGGGTDIGGTDFAFLQFWFEVDRDDVVGSEVFNFVLHTDPNITFAHYKIELQTMDTAVGNFLGPSVTIVFAADNDGFKTGIPLNVPLTTVSRLLAQNAMPEFPAPGERTVLRFIAYAPFDDMPANGELVIFDAELAETRDKVLTSAGTIIAFNFAWSALSVPIILAATPWITWRDILTFGRGRR